MTTETPILQEPLTIDQTDILSSCAQQFNNPRWRRASRRPGHGNRTTFAMMVSAHATDQCLQILAEGFYSMGAKDVKVFKQTTVPKNDEPVRTVGITMQIVVESTDSSFW